jgi:hypothetical protein
MEGPRLHRDSPSERRLRRLARWFAKADEFRRVHRDRALSNRRKLDSFMIGGLLASSAMTVALLVAPPDTLPLVNLVVGVGSALVSFVYVFLKFAG